MIDIYHSLLWEKAYKFHDFIDEAIDEFGFDKSKTLMDIFQMGQYVYYNRLASYILNELADYVKEEL